MTWYVDLSNGLGGGGPTVVVGASEVVSGSVVAGLVTGSVPLLVGLVTGSVPLVLGIVVGSVPLAVVGLVAGSVVG